MILPAYNSADCVERAVGSVLGQTYPNLELIVVDDGSSDGTPDLLESVFHDPRLVVRRLGENRGPYVARNAGVTASRGEVVAFIDADDEWRADKLELQLDELLDQGLDMVHSRVVDVYPDGERMPRMLHRRASDWRENLCNDRVATSTVLLRREVFERLGGFDETLRAMGDWDLWVRVMRGGAVGHSGEPLATVYLRPGSIQRGPVEAFEQAHRAVLDRRLPALRAARLVRAAEAQHHYAIATKLWAAERAPEARRRLVRSLRTRPTVQAAMLLAVTTLPRTSAERVRRGLRRGRALVAR